MSSGRREKEFPPFFLKLSLRYFQVSSYSVNHLLRVCWCVSFVYGRLLFAGQSSLVQFAVGILGIECGLSCAVIEEKYFGHDVRFPERSKDLTRISS